MKWPAFFLSAFLFLSLNCGMSKQELEIKKRESELNNKEQELLLKERTLALKEEELVKREHQLDSTNQQDTASTYNTNLVGTWSVKMTNVETTCPGSAVGDTKTEQWEIAYQNTQVIAKALSGDKLVRIYNGTFKESTLELRNVQDSTLTQPSTQMMVRLRMSDATTMEGQREIIRGGDCKMIYNLQMSKL